jgi:hypothetical protein
MMNNGSGRRYETSAERVSRESEDDRDGRRRLLCHERWCGACGKNDIDLKVDEFCRDFPESCAVTFRPTILNRDGTSFDPAEITQTPVLWVSAEAVAPPREPMVGSPSGCCARAGNDQAAAQPSSVIISRRFMIALSRTAS